jgi:hypothetical protein
LLTLRRIVICFFDDILIYGEGMEEYLKHLRVVLETLVQNQLHAKRSKCQFGCKEIGYLRHLIFAAGVKADPAKLQIMIGWTLPKTLKSVRGFLGPTACYKKLIGIMVLYFYSFSL